MTRPIIHIDGIYDDQFSEIDKLSYAKYFLSLAAQKVPNDDADNVAYGQAVLNFILDNWLKESV